MNGLHRFLSHGLKKSSSILGGTSCVSETGEVITGIYQNTNLTFESGFGGTTSTRRCTMQFEGSMLTCKGVTFKRGQIWTIKGEKYRVTSFETEDSSTLVEFKDPNEQTDI